MRRLFDVPEYFIDSFKNTKVFLVRINSNKFTAKFLFNYLFIYSQKKIIIDTYNEICQIKKINNVTTIKE